MFGKFPNDGYLLDARLARTIGYRSPAGVEVYIDTDFALRVGAALGPHELAYVDAFVSRYRISDDAITTSAASRRSGHPRDAVALYRALAALDLPPSSEPARRFMLRTFVDSAVKGFALQGDRATALRLFASPAYGWRKRLSARGAYHLALIVAPGLDSVRRYS